LLLDKPRARVDVVAATVIVVAVVMETAIVIVVAVVKETAIVIVEDAVVTALTALTATVVMTRLNATTTVRTTKNHTNVHQVKRKQDLLSEIRVRDKFKTAS
jgi:hypothetical protein